MLNYINEVLRGEDVSDAESLMTMYYDIKENNDDIERELEGREKSFDWDSAVASEKAKQEDIRRHRFDEAYARKMLNAEFERSERLKNAVSEKNEAAAKEKERFESAVRQREYDEYLRDKRRREEEYRREEERRREEEMRYEYEQRRREEEEYERRRRADEEYYDQLRQRGY